MWGFACTYGVALIWIKVLSFNFNYNATGSRCFVFSKEKDRQVINNFERRDVFGKHVSENRSGC